MPLILIAERGPAPQATTDWASLKREVLGKLDVAAEFRALGVEFTGPERSSGWRECRAAGRHDEHPSAAVNVRTGVYKSNGDGAETLNLFDFALGRGGGRAGSTWPEVLRHYADKAGVDFPGAQRYGDKGRVEAVYPYRAAGGGVLFEVVRYRRDDGSKTFRQRRPDGNGGYTASVKGVAIVPYDLPEVLARPDEVVWVVEGEKDVERLKSEGLLGTCNPMGTGDTKCWAELSRHFAGRDAVVIPDNDSPGWNHATAVAGHLRSEARSVRLVELPDLGPRLPKLGLDVSDWLDRGHTIDELGRLAHQAPEWAPPGDDAARDATVADLRPMQAAESWVWPGWIPTACLTLLAAEAGTGKTRFCFDLHRRIVHGLPWPDGTPMTLPPDARVLWVAADQQWQELCDVPDAFAIPDQLIFLNSNAADPYSGTNLETADEMADLEARIQRVRPCLTFIDTITNTGDFKAESSADAKRQYKPLQEISTRCQAAIICVTHLNAGGKVLGRRAVEKVRVVIQEECPDPEGQPNRRKLHVTKSKARKPDALGVTMGDAGNEYDTNPPEPAAPAERFDGVRNGPAPAKTRECMEWLAARLAPGPDRVSNIRRESDQLGYSAGTLYQSRDRLGVVEETIDNRKWWRIVVNGENGNVAPNQDRPF